jgi:hypothetical protein
MAFPVVAASAITEASADQTSHVINLPTGIASGNLLLLWFTMDGASGNAVSTPSGWTLMQTTNVVTNGDFGVLFCRTADGSEGSTVTITSTGTSQSSAAVCLRITGHSGTVESQGTSNPANAIGIVLTALTPTHASQGLLVTCANTAGNRDTTDNTAPNVVKSTTTGLTTNTQATVTYRSLSVSSALETVLNDGLRQSSSSPFSGVVVMVHGDALSGSAKPSHPFYQTVIA